MRWWPCCRAWRCRTTAHFEVVVADDGSTLEHQQVIQSAAARLGLPLSHVWHPDVGFTASRVRNLGVSVARGDYIVFMDGDCVPETDFVRRHRQLRETACLVNGSRVLLSAKLTQAVLNGSAQVCGRSAWYWLGRRWAKDANKLTGLLRLPDLPWRKNRVSLARHSQLQHGCLAHRL